MASAAALRPHDWLFPQYRELGAFLWRGVRWGLQKRRVFKKEESSKERSLQKRTVSKKEQSPKKNSLQKRKLSLYPSSVPHPPYSFPHTPPPPIPPHVYVYTTPMLRFDLPPALLSSPIKWLPILHDCITPMLLLDLTPPSM